jgi:ubiquinone biosynthesis protein UbiJ
MTTADHLTDAKLTAIGCGAAILAVHSDKRRRVTLAASITQRVIRRFPQLDNDTAIVRAVVLAMGNALLDEMELIPMPSEVQCMVAEIRRLRERVARLEQAA